MTYRVTLTDEQDDQEEILIDSREITADVAITILANLVNEQPLDIPVDPDPEPRIVKIQKGKRAVRKCSACGKPGHIARKCPGSSEPAAESEKIGQPLTEDQYVEVQAAKSDGTMVSSEMAKEFDVPLREINIAIFSRDYDTYLKNRSKRDV